VLSLPEDADPDRVEATYRNGILHIRVAKREASRPRRIEIRDAQPARIATEGGAA
jgi:HSP20 family protein